MCEIWSVKRMIQERAAIKGCWERKEGKRRAKSCGFELQRRLSIREQRVKAD